MAKEGGAALLFVAGQGRVGQTFTSPLPPAIISLICAPHLSLFTPAPLLLPPSFPSCLVAFDTQQSVWSEVRKGEGGTLARHWTSDPSTRRTFLADWPTARTLRPSVLAITTLVPFAFAQTGTQGLKKQHRRTSSKSFITAKNKKTKPLPYGSDFIVCRSSSLLAFTNKITRIQSLLPTLRNMPYAEEGKKIFIYCQDLYRLRKDGDRQLWRTCIF